MTELELYNVLVVGIFFAAALTFVALFFVNAPYGRYLRAGWGPTIPARVAWVVMESPAVLLFIYVYSRGEFRAAAAPLALLCMWQFHYVYRAFIYPFRLRKTAHRMPVLIVAMAILFNSANAYVNARWISHFGSYSESWLSTPAFVLGLTIFLLGWAINQHSDLILMRLQGSGGTDYKIPRGGLYRQVSCPNYFGEMLEWIGWAIAAWSIAGLSFAVFTIANLLPRAIANHRWYRDEFDDYPQERKAVIPYML